MFNLKKCPYCDSKLLVESESKVKFWYEEEEEEKSTPKLKVEKPTSNTGKKLQDLKERKKKVLITDDIRRAVLSRFNLGQGTTQISKETGISKSAIHKIKQSNSNSLKVATPENLETELEDSVNENNYD
jgi:hypothetical protein